MKLTTNEPRIPWFYLKQGKRSKSYLAVFMAFLMLNLSTGCNYYKTREVPLTKENLVQTIEEFNQQYNYALINQSWHLEDLKINEDEGSISGLVRFPTDEHRSDKVRELGKTYRYKKDKKQPFNELHFKVNSTIKPTPGETLTIMFTDIQAISVNDKNTGRTVLNIVAGTVGTLFATLLIIAALKSSCPFVYIKSGEAYVFQGELYPGIIAPKLQKLDYLPLPDLEQEGGTYTIKVTNELKEIQRTDLLELWVAQHQEGVQLVMDQQGQIHSFTRLMSPAKIRNEAGELSRKTLLKKDDHYYTFNNKIPSSNSLRELRLEFNRPPEHQDAKLLLSLKNSLWLDYVFGKFNEQFGSYYNAFQQDQQTLSKEIGEQWVRDQNIPLKVLMKTSSGWKEITQINTVGPMATRDIAITLPEDDILEDYIEIKLQTGFMFWDLDYAAIDYSENKDFVIHKIKPASAIDENGEEVSGLLQMQDNSYLVQPAIGNQVTVNFSAPKMKTGLKQTAFLVNQGYYTYIRNYDGVPNFGKLKTFRNKNTFTRFSENMYKAIMNLEEPLDLASNE